MNIRLKPLAGLLPLVFSLPTLAAGELYAALDPITVTATRQQMRASEVLSDVTVIERDEIDRAGQSTLEELLARQPGVEFVANGSYGANSSLFIRGTNSKHTLLLIDGMRIGSLTAGDVSWSRLPTSQIERIEILRGPASALYGSDAIGGVVQIFTRQGNGPLSFHGEMGVGTFNTQSASAGLSGSQDGWRYALNVADHRTDGFNTKKVTRGADRDKDGFDNQSISGRVSRELAKGHDISASFFHSDGENQYDAGSNDRNHLILNSFNVAMKNRLSDAWTSHLSLGQSEDDSKNTGTYKSAFRSNQTQYAWQNDLKTSLGSFLLGLERLEQKVTSTTAYQVTERTNDSAQIGWLGKYENHRLQLSKRYDDNSQFGSKSTGSAAYGYQISPNWRAHIGYGTAFKAPSFNDLYWPFASYGAWGSYQGNPSLKPEFARNRETSLTYETAQHRVTATWFLNNVENLINSSGGFNAMPINIGNARLEGAALAYEGKVGEYALQANYNYQEPMNADNDKVLARRAKNFGGASVGRSLGNWDWRLEVQGSDYRYDNASNSKRLPGYALANVYGAYRFARDWSVFARINNLFDRDYVLADGYATPGVNAFIGVRYSPK